MPPWGFPSFAASGAARTAAPFSAADFWTETPRPSYPVAPAPVRGYQDLDPAQRRDLRTRALLLAAQAIGAGSSTGEVGTALAGSAGQFMDERDRYFYDASREREEAYRRARERIDAETEEQRRSVLEGRDRNQAAAYATLANRLIAEEPALEGRVRAAVTARDLGTLRELESDLPRRRALKTQGFEPDDPFADEKARARITTEELERRREAELEDLPRELGMRGEAEVEQRQRMRGLGLLWEPNAAGGGGSPYNLQRFEQGGQQFIFDPRAGTAAPLAGVPTAPAPADALWQKAVEQAQRERSESVGIGGPEINVEERARRIYDIANRPPRPKPQPPRVLDRQPTAPTAGRVGAQPIRMQSSHGSNPLVPAAQQGATARLNAVTDPERKRKVAEARAEGYSDDEIAQFLGL